MDEVNSPDLLIAEIPYDSGEIHFRFACYEGAGGRAVRHGLFRAYYRGGALASEGSFSHDKEHGDWKDFHENGQLAAEGAYENGIAVGEWKHWDAEGKPSDQ